MSLLGMTLSGVNPHYSNKNNDAKSCNDGWYDYENQKALRPPPIGEAVQVLFGGGSAWHDAYTVGADNGICVVRSNLGFDLAYDIRPLDWDKNKNAEMLKIAEIVCEHGSSVGCMEVAKAILAAGYRKCDKGE